MSQLGTPPALKGPPPQPLLPAPDRDTPESPPGGPAGRGGSGRPLLGLGALLLFTTALAAGVRRHYEQHRQVMDTAERQANFVPNVRVEAVAQRFGRLHVTLPATTPGFEAANIFARASGYVLKRYVDIGDHVNAGQLLAETSREGNDGISFGAADPDLEDGYRRWPTGRPRHCHCYRHRCRGRSGCCGV